MIQLYPDSGDFIFAAGMVFDLGTAYLSFRIARMTRYTPTGWYLLTAAWILKIGRDLLTVAGDLMSPNGVFELETSSISLVVSATFFAGLYLLRRDFQELMGLPKSTTSTNTEK